MIDPGIAPPAIRQPEAPLVSIVIPAYNEAENLRRCVLTQLSAWLADQAYDADVVFVDDGSEDETAQIAGDFAASHAAFRVISIQHAGKAAAVTRGVLEAMGEFVLFMDADLATKLDHITEFTAQLERGDADIVIASRETRGAVRRGTPAVRRLMGKVFNRVVRVLLLSGLSDTQCGFKAFRRDVAQDLFCNMVVFASARPVKGPLSTAFDVELLVMARRRGYRVLELPVFWQHVTSFRVSALRDPFRMFLQVLRVWGNDRRGVYRAREKAKASR